MYHEYGDYTAGNTACDMG